MRAIFEGWLDRNRETAIAKGPFEVEVFEVPATRRMLYRARLLPTRLPFFEGPIDKAKEIERKTPKEVQNAIEALFETKVRDWK